MPALVIFIISMVAVTNTLQSIREERGNGDPGIPLIYTQCRDFLIEAVEQLIVEMFSNCQKLDVLNCLCPEVAYNLQVPSLNELHVSMRAFLADIADLQSVDEEPTHLILNPDLNESLSPEKYWRFVFHEMTSSGEQVKSNLIKVVK